MQRREIGKDVLRLQVGHFTNVSSFFKDFLFFLVSCVLLTRERREKQKKSPSLVTYEVSLRSSRSSTRILYDMKMETSLNHIRNINKPHFRLNHLL